VNFLKVFCLVFEFITILVPLINAQNRCAGLCLAGNSAIQAILLLLQKGVPESHIIFLNLISVSITCNLE
jgi:hypothetical protein